jgi:hypothetical protein
VQHHSTAASAGSIDSRGKVSIRSLGQLGSALVALCFLIASFAATQAQALDRYQSEGVYTDAPFSDLSDPSRAAVDDATGNLLVVDPGNNQVYVFGPGGVSATHLASFGSGELSSPYGIAIDQTNGDVYLSDAGNNRIVRYTTDGQPTPTYTLDATYTSPAQGTDASEGEIGSFAAPLAIEAGSGDLLVLDPGNKVVSRFTSSGTFVRSLDGSATDGGPFLNPLDIAVGDGVTYVLDTTDTTPNPASGVPVGTSRVERFAADGTSLGALPNDGRINTAWTIAYGPDTGSVFIGVQRPGLPRSYVQIYRENVPSSSVTYTDSSLAVRGIAVDEGSPGASHRVYALTDQFVGFGGVGFEVFKRLQLPDVVIDPASNIEQRSAELSGSADPLVGTVTAHFEVSSDGGATWNPVATGDDTATAPDVAQPTADLTDLTPFTAYQARLVADNQDGQAISPVISFRTLGEAPLIAAESTIERGAAFASVRALITPNGQATSFHVEYGPTAEYGARIPADSERTAGASLSPYGAVQTIPNLQPETTYHFRFVARNATGESVGADQTFTTTGIAPSRAYELVTPPEKGGNNVRAELGLQASADGNTLAYLGTVVLGDQAEADPLYPRYVAQRSASGWSSSKPTDPLQLSLQAQTGPINLTFGVSEDGTKALVISLKALAPGAVDGNSNVYLRDVATGSLTLVGSAEGDDLFNTETGTFSALFADGTPNFDHLLVRPTGAAFLPGVPDGALYDFTAGELKVVSLSPEGAPLLAGSVGTKEHDKHLISPDGKRMVFGAGAGGVYFREDGVTRAISASRRESDAGTIQPGRPIGSSRDLRYTFFLSHDLTDVSEPGLDTLYRYDAVADDLETLSRTLDVPGKEGSVSGFQVSHDGSTVVFSSPSVLSSGAAEGRANIYMWREGKLSLIAPLDLSLDLNASTGTATWWLSPGGRYFAFSAATKVTTYDTASTACVAFTQGDSGVACHQIYRYDGDSGAIVCASCPPDGSPATGNATLGWDRNETGTHAFPRLVNDNGVVFFNSPEALASRDTNNAPDVYEFDGEQDRLISTGKGTGALLAEVSEDGRDVFFTTRDQLLPIDRDSAIDIYDARFGGGFSTQSQLPPSTSCSGEDCSPAGIAQPAPSAPSETTKGRGNVVGHQKHCGKGRVMRKVKGKKRCVRKQKHRTNTNRRHGR